MSGTAAESLKRQQYFQRDTTACPNHRVVSPNAGRQMMVPPVQSLRKVSGRISGLNADVESKYNAPICSSFSLLNQLPLAHLPDLYSPLFALPASAWDRTALLSDIQFSTVFILKDQISTSMNVISV